MKETQGTSAATAPERALAGVPELLRQLADLGIALDARDGKLQVSAPPGTMTPALRETLAHHRDALLHALQAAAAPAVEQALPTIVPDPASGHLPFPLNDVQHAYWMGRNTSLELGGVSTHIYLEFACGALDPERLARALDRVIARHGMLRGTIDGEGQQRVLPSVPPYALLHDDLRGLAPEERQRRVEAIRERMSQQVIPCDRWPLYEVRLATLEDGATRLFTSWDFLMIDAWSLLLIFREWHGFYEDPGFAPKVTDLGFRDYLIAEEALTRGRAYAVARDYWMERVDTLPLAPSLPLSGRIEIGRKYPFTRRRMVLPAAQWQAFKTYAKQAGLTLSSALLAAFSQVIDRWSKDPRYSLNLTLFNRRDLHPDVDVVVGDFTNLLVFEVDGGLRAGERFVDRAMRVQKRFLRDYEHREFGAVRLLREIRRRRNLHQRAILPVVFTSTLMLDGSRGEDNSGLECFGDMDYGISQTPQVWLDHQIFEIDGDLVINWDAVDEVFIPGVLDDMFEAHRLLLESLSVSADAWRAEVDAGLPARQRALREAVNATDAELPEGCLHAPFVAQALRTPERPAVHHEGGALRYGELLALATRAADGLVARGVASNELVAIVMPKGVAQVIAAYAVLIAGAAYLPIDPSWPAKRRELLLEQAETRFALVEADDAVADGWIPAVERIALDTRTPAPAPTAPPPVRQRAQDLAYVIFTSGSTGMPKGVMIDHRGALNTVHHINRLFDVGADDAVLGVSELTFDLSVYDVFGPLAVGGALVLPAYRSARDPDHWLTLIERHGVSVWNSAPQLMGMLVDAAEHGAGNGLRGLRLAMMSGDWIPVAIPDRLRALAPSVVPVSLGGATEGSIWSIYRVIDRVDPAWPSIPYGKPLPNQQMHVLDAELRPCPELVTGDIYIGGVGVALGYWKDAEKTARQFVVDAQGRRLYRTGDLGRYLRDGDIEFLGREDSQVKLRGYRVELGEIAAAIRSHPAIAESVVKIRREEGRDSLTAYLVPDKAVDDSELFQGAAQPAIGCGASADALAAGAAVGADGGRADLALFAEMWARMERICLRGMLETLRALDLVDAGLDYVKRLTDLKAKGEVRPRYSRLVDRWLRLLQEQGALRMERGRVASLPGDLADGAPAQARLDALRTEVAGHPALLTFLDHVGDCLRLATAQLSGAVAPQELLFPQGEWGRAEALYQRNPAVIHHNAAIAAMVSRLIRDAGDAPLRVLEVGAGTGGTSASVLRAVAQARVDYAYTDISSYFFNRARRKFAEYPFVRYEVFDIDKPPAAQGHAAHDYDLIVAANVSHNARELGASLANLRELLKPGGHLIMLEGTRNTIWQFATIGYLEMVDEYHDVRMEQDAPVLDIAQWKAALESAGFAGVYALPAADSGSDPALCALLEAAMPQHVVVATAPERIRSLRPAALSAYLAERLPQHMVPQDYVALERFPLTANGKVDMDALPAARAESAGPARVVVEARSRTERTLIDIWRRVLGRDDIGATDHFFEVGGDSLLLIEVMRSLNSALQTSVTIPDLFSYSTIAELSKFIDGEASAPREEAAEARVPAQSQDIAIIGMAGRFPDAPDVETFWRNLVRAHCAVREFSEEELLAAGTDPRELGAPGYVRAGVVLDDIDRFDAAHFGFTPREAQVMDPQQRMLLECAVHALDNAGYPDESRAGSIGVFVGKGVSMYMLEHVLPDARAVADLGFMSVLGLNDKDYAATLLSYKLGLTGPSLNINTACSTSLVTVHTACRSLIDGECDMALAGGASVVDTRSKAGHIHIDGHIASSDGYCRAFADDADGCVFGSGVGLVVLKRLDRALRDGDTIHAVIKGSAINNDGAAKVGFTAPTAQGQAAAISAALSIAGVCPDSIQSIEAHGTGTHMGDPIEFSGLRQVFGGPRADGSVCALGSVKSAIGHLDSAAGIAGLIKTALSLRHGVLPATLHAQVPNRHIPFADSPFVLNTATREWPRTAGPRRAGVSAFGVGGTNAHVVLEEPPQARRTASAPAPAQLLPLSARTRTALERQCAQLADALAEAVDLRLEDIAHTLQVGRSERAWRSFVVCEGDDSAGGGIGQAARMLAAGDIHAPAHRSETGRTPVAFLLREDVPIDAPDATRLRDAFPAFAAAYARCSEVLRALCGDDLEAPATEEQRAAARFARQYALASVWGDCVGAPVAIYCEGLGELVAAAYAGVLSLEEALSLVIVRCRLSMETAPEHADQAEAQYRECVGDIRRRVPEIGLLPQSLGEWLQGDGAAMGWLERLHPPASPQATAKLEDLAGVLRIDFGGVEVSAVPAVDRADAAAGDVSCAAAVLTALGRAWCAGAALRWEALHDTRSLGRVPLPPTVFEDVRHWLPKRQALRSAIFDLGADPSAQPAHALADAAAAGEAGLEAVLAGIWRDCLGIDDIGLDDNFFDLGGDSVMALRMRARIKSEFDVDLPANKLHAFATLRHLQRFIAVSRDRSMIETLSEEELGELLALMED